MDNIKTAINSALESLNMVKTDMPDGLAKSYVLGHFQGVEEQLKQALEQLENGKVHIVCCNDGMENATFDSMAAESEAQRLKVEWDKKWEREPNRKPFAYFHVHDVPMMKGSVADEQKSDD